MSLSCECGDYDDPEWWYQTPDDYSVLQTKKRKRCSSCDSLISIGATVLKFSIWRNPRTEIEEKIYGEGGEIYLAPMYHCESCADLYLSLVDLGFCAVAPDENMRMLLEEYHEVYGPAKRVAA